MASRVYGYRIGMRMECSESRPEATNAAAAAAKASLMHWLATPASRFDQPQRFTAHEDLRVVPLTPAERRHVAVLAQRSASVPLFEPCTNGGPDVRVGTAVEQ